MTLCSAHCVVHVLSAVHIYIYIYIYVYIIGQETLATLRPELFPELGGVVVD